VLCLSREISTACSAPPRPRALSSSAWTTATTPRSQRNADVFVREKVDLVIEFHANEGRCRLNVKGTGT
jgi:hypothetical protein